MLIFAIDDEPRLLHALHSAIEEAEPRAEITMKMESEMLEQAMTPDTRSSGARLCIRA